MADSPIYWFDMGPWPYFVGFTTSEADFAAEMKRLGLVDVDALASTHANATAHFLTSNCGTGMAVIFIQPMRRAAYREQYASMLAHEAVHIVQDMRERLGDLGREAEAYIVQHIVQNALQITWKTGRVKRIVPLPA